MIEYWRQEFHYILMDFNYENICMINVLRVTLFRNQ